MKSGSKCSSVGWARAVGARDAVVEQRGPVVRVQAFGEPIGKSHDVVRGRCTAQRNGAPVVQVMSDVAAADDQKPSPDERRERAADLQRVARAALRLHRQRHDRYMRCGEHLAQRNPRPVIEATRAIDGAVDAGGAQRQGDFARGGGVSMGGVAQGVERRVEAVEVVNGFELGGSADRRCGRCLMRAYDHDGPRRLEPSGDLGHRPTDRAGVEREDRSAVGDEEGVAAGVHRICTRLRTTASAPTRRR